MLQANVLTAMLVGFWGREWDGLPGSQVLAEGVRALQLVVWYERQRDPGGAKHSRRRKFNSSASATEILVVEGELDAKLRCHLSANSYSQIWL